MKKLKYFVSAIIPGVRPVGIMQFEATEDTFKEIAEKLCPERAEFKAYVVKQFDDGVPVDKFINADEAKKLGY